MLSDNKLIKLRNVQGGQNDLWYITKQNCNFRDLCYIANILELWNNDESINFQGFFDQRKALPPYSSVLPSNTAHRATLNCTYFGLLRQSSAGSYNPDDLTPVYYYIKNLCHGNFSNTECYQHVIDNQLEKMSITNNNFAIHPIMFTLKILLLIGDATGDYSISIEEFKLFVATAQRYKEYLEVAQSILRFRQDEDFRKECQKYRSNVSDTRYNLVVKNHSFFDETTNSVSLYTDKIKETRRRVAEFELKESIDSDINKQELYDVTVMRTEQIIYFGAPGTGKSFKVEHREGETEEDRIRTTFHPDTDYSSFVGCYKPMQDEDDPKKIVYKFEGQSFTKAYVEAWKRLVARKEGQNINYTLVIEEINRGNCAQIFGDIFQLLDRNEDGFSQYGIQPDEDLTTFLMEEFERKEIKDKLIEQGFGRIADGTEMKLPPNLSIIATMNTSDQSLFPIDSAFKRRWDWEYIPIKYEPKNAEGHTIANKIDIEGTIYDWGKFIKAVNKRIYDLTKSEDKELGYFFVRPAKGENITTQRFVSKVIFYLWSDIYKDYAGRDNSIFKFSEDGDEKNRIEHSFNSFFENGFIQVNLVKKFIEQFVVKESNTSIVEFKEDPNKYNPTYNINGEGDYSARKLPSEVMRLYVKAFSDKTPEQVVDEWLSLGVNVSHFVETVEQYEERTDEKDRVERIEWENGVVYVTTHGWVYSTNEQYKVSTILQFINAVNKRKWKDISLGVN